MNAEQMTTLEKKIGHFSRILSTRPDDELTILALAEASFRRGLKLEALTAYQAVGSGRPVPEAHLAVAEIYSAQGMPHEAYGELRRLFELDPENVEARLLVNALQEDALPPEEVRATMDRPTTEEAFDEARLRLKIQRTIYNRELQERTRNVTLEPGTVIHEYHMEEAKKKLIRVDELLRELERFREYNHTLGLEEPEPPRAEPIAAQGDPELSPSEELPMVEPDQAPNLDELPAELTGGPEASSEPGQEASPEGSESQEGAVNSSLFVEATTPPENPTGSDADAMTPVPLDPEPIEAVPSAPPLQAAPEPAAETQNEPPVQVASEPIAEVQNEPPVPAEPEPVGETQSEPLLQVAPEPVADSQGEPSAQLAPEPVPDSPIEPTVQLAAEPVADTQGETSAPVMTEPASTPGEPSGHASSELVAPQSDSPAYSAEASGLTASEPAVQEAPEPISQPLEAVERGVSVDSPSASVEREPAPHSGLDMGPLPISAIAPPAAPSFTADFHLSMDSPVDPDLPDLSVDLPNEEEVSSMVDLAPIEMTAEEAPSAVVPPPTFDDAPVRPEPTSFTPISMVDDSTMILTAPESALPPRNPDPVAPVSPDPVEPAPLPVAETSIEPTYSSTEVEVPQSLSPARKAFYETHSEALSGLTTTLARTRGVTSIYLVAREGVTIDSVAKDEISEKRVGDLVRESFEFLEAFASDPAYWVLECAGGIFVMQRLDDRHVLIAIGQAGANFGALRYTMDKTRTKFEQLLAQAPQ